MKVYHARPNDRLTTFLEAIQVIGLTAFLLGLFALVYIAVLLMAPEGAR